MQYFISFLEGIITFISPCLLPMLPVYLSYFAGGEDSKRGKTLKNALGFVLGFTVVFVILGAFAGTLGFFLKEHRMAVDILTGAVVVVFGLSFLGLFSLPLPGGKSNPLAGKELGFFSSMLFGAVFSISWTPCVGAFLGSALMMASSSGDVLRGVIMLLLYSAGLGVPFIASALLIDKLKSTFDFIKRNYKAINIVCGILLILVGLLMMTGLMGKYLSFLG